MLKSNVIVASGSQVDLQAEVDKRLEWLHQKNYKLQHISFAMKQGLFGALLIYDDNTKK